MLKDSKNITITSNKLTEEPLTEALRARRQRELRKEKEAERRASKASIVEKWKTHKYWLPRATYYLLHSIWIATVAIGGFIAWLISILFI